MAALYAADPVESIAAECSDVADVDGSQHEVEASLIRPEEASMAVIMMQTLPDGMPIAMLDAVTAKMDAKANPPDGLVVHTHYERDGHAHVLDVWQSRVQYEMFRNERLLPAMMEVAAQHGLDLGDGPPEPTIIDAHDFVLGR